MDVYATGLGLICAAGNDLNTSWERVLAGKGMASRDPRLEGVRVDFSCHIDPNFNFADHLGRGARKLELFVALALVAVEEALADANIDTTTWDSQRVGVVLGCGIGGAPIWDEQHTVLMQRGPDRVSPHLIPRLISNMVSGHVAMKIGANGPNMVTATACASATTAIGTAMDLIRSGRCDIVIAGGSEGAITPLSVAGFDNMTALSRNGADPTIASRPFDRDRDGFVIGEGAGIVVLESAEHAKKRDANYYGKVAGYGASADAHHITAPHPQGAGAELAVKQALQDAKLNPEDIVHINAHGTSTPLNDLAEANMIARVIGDHPVITSTKGVTGHALGAAGGIEAVLTFKSMKEGIVPPTANLENQADDIPGDIVSKEPRELKISAAMSNSFGFGGQNAVLVFTA